MKLGLFPFELINSTTVRVTRLTSSPCAASTVKILLIPSGTPSPPSKLTPTALVCILYSTSKFVIFILPGVSALNDKNTTSSPSPLLAISWFMAETNVGVDTTSLPTIEESLT